MRLIKNVLKKNKFRNKISLERLRLSIFRSSNHIYCQIIDDKKRITIVSASSIEKTINKKNNKNINKTFIAFEVGKLLSERALFHGIKKVFFDRNKYLYHGRVKSLAEGARKKGLNF